jgi:hypothetical protein
MTTKVKETQESVESVGTIKTKEQALTVLYTLHMHRKTLAASIEQAEKSMRFLVEEFGDDEKLDEVDIKVLEKFKVDVPVKKRLQDTKVNGLLYFTGLGSSLDAAGAVQYLQSYHKDLVDELTKRVLNVELFEQAVRDGKLKSETTSKLYKAPAPKAVCKVV